MKTTLYELLEVEQNATAAEIKKQFRKLSKQWHPDISTEPNAQERFNEIVKANEVLSDEASRKEYDEILKAGGQPKFSEAFEFMKKNGAMVKGADIRLSVIVDYKKMINEEKVVVRYKRKVNCECAESGVVCTTCQGTGGATKEVFTVGGYVTQFAPCNDCRGVGHTFDKCDLCDDNSQKEKNAELHISLKDFHYGMTAQFLGYGNEGRNGARDGALYIKIIQPDAPTPRVLYENSLEIERMVTVPELLLHDEVDVELPSGEIVSLTPNIHSTTLLSGKSFKDKNGKAGDVYVKFILDIQPITDTKKRKKFLDFWKKEIES